MPNWTRDQNLAINTFGGKVIVSAAAGSGKTAVLSERVLKLVLNKKSIDKLLVVTFTNKAAGEMRERIKLKLEEAYKSDKGNDYLKNQIMLTKGADITTMDAFYSTLVKNNFEKLNIEKDFNILSNEEEVILKNKVVKNVLENAFLEIDNFEDLLIFFGANSIDLIKDVVIKVSDFLSTIAFKDEFYKKALTYYEKDNNFYKEELFKIIKNKMSSYLKLYDDITHELYSSGNDFDKVLLLAQKEKNYINDFININSFDDLSKRIRLISFDRLMTPKGRSNDSVIIKYKSVRESFKNEINKNLKELGYINDKDYEKEKEVMYNNLKTLFEVVKIYDEKLFLNKKKINSYSFSDISHLCLDLLIKDGKKTNLARKLEEKYDEILIDEYQDTNNMQNVIFNAISKEGSNLFIVGDVKQSIYKFRSAKPEIFNNDKRKANLDSFPRLITLKKNFRSRKEVLDFCNFIFSNTMTNLFGEVDYNDDEKLYLGASFKESKDLDSEVILINNGKETNEEEENDLTSVEKEAIVVAEKIKHLIDTKYQVYDNKKLIFRDIKPSDIVILLRSLTNSEVFKEALNKRGISVYKESSNEYIDNYEIKLVINILKSIDNLYDDIALMSVLTSDIIGTSYNEIAKYKPYDKYLSLYEVLYKYGDDKIKNEIDKLKNLKEESYTLSISKLLSKIYKSYNVIPILSAFKGGIKRQKNLELMIKHASSFDDKGNYSLHKFISYLEDVILNKTSLSGVNPLSDGESVLITTIHKSKGLEYPVVILSQIGKKFNFKDIRCDSAINEDLGFICNIKDNYYKLKYESVPMLVYKTLEKNKMLSEELRILYVALTRAKEKLIVTGTINNLDKKVTDISSKIGDDIRISNLYLSNVNSYLDIILPCLLRHKDGSSLRDIGMIDVKVFNDKASIKIDIKDGNQIDESEFNKKNKELKTIIDYDKYKGILDTNYVDNYDVPKYLSVSDIKKKEDYLRNPSFLTDGINHASIGSLYHKILEELPVKKYSIKELEETLNNILSKEELKLISLEKLFSYLTSDIYYELLDSDKFYKELQINFKIPSSYYDNSLKSGTILTSGVIDLLYIKNDIYNIVDYKTDNVDNMDELKDLYKIQLDLYEIALKQKYNAKKVKKYIYSIKLAKFIEV